MAIHQLFPQPVCFSKLERKLTKKELTTIDTYQAKTYKNEGNLTSKDNYVLENKPLKNLKKDLNKAVIDYFNEVVCANNSITPYITQSWINYTETNQFHHKHSHSNSYVSGVFYIDAKKEVDHIIFNKSGYQQLKLSIAQANQFNSMVWKCSVQTSDVILFPSTLMHEVFPKEGTNTRISLSFNVFFKGKIGTAERLTELVLE